MRYLIVIFLFASSAIKLDAQGLCPNVFNCGDTLFDTRDGYKYPTVLIGTQCWMQTNLQATKYLNGDSINHITDNTVWGSYTIGAWCDANNDPANGLIYGHLYNGYAISDSRSLCPAGWYVPTNNEMYILFDLLGGTTVCGGKMKDSTGWPYGGDGSNSSGFSALPGGYRYDSSGGGQFSYFLYASHMWSCEQYQYDLDWTRINIDLSYSTSKSFGWSVRCLKGN